MVLRPATPLLGKYKYQYCTSGLRTALTVLVKIPVHKLNSISVEIKNAEGNLQKEKKKKERKKDKKPKQTNICDTFITR